jgi:hypothetical protein
MNERFTNTVLFEIMFEIRTGLTKFDTETHCLPDLESFVDEIVECSSNFHIVSPHQFAA